MWAARAAVSQVVCWGALLLLACGPGRVGAATGDQPATRSASSSQAQEDITAMALAEPVPTVDPPSVLLPDLDTTAASLPRSLPLRRAMFTRPKSASPTPSPSDTDLKTNPIDQTFYLAGQGNEVLANAMTDLLNSKTTKMYFDSKYMINLGLHGPASPTKRTS